MSLTTYGRDVAVPVLLGSVVVILAGILLPPLWLKIPLIAAGGFVFLFTLNFFRDPERRTPDVPGAVISPADGKVISISEITEEEFMGGRAMQVCVFMSPLNVHVNRWPMSGTVTFFRYIEGRFIAAFEDQASDLNERTMVGLDTDHGRVLFKQISGFVARRIVCPVKVGDTAECGRRFGMIKFGSRVDVLMPMDADIRVALGQKVTAGETVLAVLSAQS